MALIALAVAGTSPGFARTFHHSTTQGLYDYAPGYGSGAAPGFGDLAGSASAPHYVPGFGNTGTGSGPSNE